MEIMEKQAFSTLFRHFLAIHELDEHTAEAKIDRFYDLTRYMMEKNQVMNLTAIREVEKIIPLHYIDCLLTATYIPYGAKVMDIGCGGGFPSLPLAIARPDLVIVGVDSTEKKVRYVQETAAKLGLNVQAIAARAEELAQDPAYREQFDVVTSRAVARLNILDELCLPFVKIGGKAVILKGAAGTEELEEAAAGIGALGGDIAAVHAPMLTVAEDDVEQRTVILINKIRKTPAAYPRAFGRIKKNPL